MSSGAKYWRNRAEELRTLARSRSTAEVRHLLLEQAAELERIAAGVESPEPTPTTRQGASATPPRSSGV